MKAEENRCLRDSVLWKAALSGCEYVGSLWVPRTYERVLGRERKFQPTSAQPAAQCQDAAPYSGLAEPEVAIRTSHDTARGAYSNRTEKRKEVVMAAPELEVLSPSAVPGEAWDPELGSFRDLVLCPRFFPSFNPWAFLWPVFLVRITWRLSRFRLDHSDSIAPTALDLIG